MHEVFKALSSEARIKILKLIAELKESKGDVACCEPEEVCVCKITERLDLAPSTVSHHLHTLKEAGILRARREGTWIYYSIDERKLAEAAEFLISIVKGYARADRVEKQSAK